ncbi:hypothetical protein PF007_g25672 [Phytophthora fragariae]|nr:hypothetical protein PF007_g25672 [Phytophthora fragariae]KAE9185083.1 hypothetical protein PF004_g23474 [Phytophthora fragariae]
MSTTHAPLSRSPPCDSAREGLHAVDIAAAQASAAVELAVDEGSAEELASEEEDSDESDDSTDEDWSSGDATAEGEEEEALTGESGKSEADVEEDIGNIMTDFDVQQCVSTLISEDK